MTRLTLQVPHPLGRSCHSWAGSWPWVAPLCSSSLPEVSLVCNSRSYLFGAYSEVDRTDTGRRTNRIHTSEWIIQIAKSKRCIQPFPVAWAEWLARQQSLQIRHSFRLDKNVICSHIWFYWNGCNSDLVMTWCPSCACVRSELMKSQWTADHVA